MCAATPTADEDNGDSSSTITMQYDTPSERSPLLKPSAHVNGHSSKGSVHADSMHSTAARQISDPKPKQMSQKNVILYLAIVVVVLGIGDQLIQSPQTRVIESIYCYKFMEQHEPGNVLVGRDHVGPGAIGGVPERLCKIDVVQGQVAMLMGWQQLLDGIPIYFWQTFPIELSWLSSLHGIFGGSSPVAVAMFFVIASDVTTEEERATVFLRLGAANLLTTFIAPPVSGLLMEFNPWIPMFLGLIIQVIPIFLMLLIPETINYGNPTTSTTFSRPVTPVVETTLAVPPDSSDRPRLLGTNFVAMSYGKLKDATGLLSQDWRVSALILPFMAYMFLLSASTILLQYISKRYGLSFSRATLILAIRSGVDVVVLLLVLPGLSKLLVTRYGMHGKKKDLYLGRASALLLSAGWSLVALSPTLPLAAVSLVIATLGSGMILLVRSFMTALIPANQVARLYTLISIVDTLGLMAGGPLLAGIFKAGLSAGGGLVGLPFLCIGILMLLVTGLLFVVRLRKCDLLEEEEEENIDEGPV
ncbi:hypothetical protein LTR50_004456 [Elasticomyces elasticus]|nr:hypothetical protein LTR50_004456 [Elasticomyces elasticus]